MAARGGEGAHGEMKVEVCNEGSVSMVTPPTHTHTPLSAPLKAVLRQQMSVSLGTLMGGGWLREGERSREQEEGLNRFSG